MSMMIHRAVQRQRKHEVEIRKAKDRPVEKPLIPAKEQETENVTVQKRGRKPKR